MTTGREHLLVMASDYYCQVVVDRAPTKKRCFVVMYCSRSGGNLTWRQVGGRTGPAAVGRGSSVSWY